MSQILHAIEIDNELIDSEIICNPGAKNLVDLFHEYKIYHTNKREHFNVALGHFEFVLKSSEVNHVGT